jgi:hypothetical protein
VLQDTVEAVTSLKENQAYNKLLLDKVGNDNFVTSATQTLEGMAVLHKVKDVQAHANSTADMFAQWDTEEVQKAKHEAAAAAAASAIAQPERIATLNHRPREALQQVWSECTYKSRVHLASTTYGRHASVHP